VDDLDRQVIDHELDGRVRPLGIQRRNDRRGEIFDLAQGVGRLPSNLPLGIDASELFDPGLELVDLIDEGRAFLGTVE
jgi:hypothetical protein